MKKIIFVTRKLDIGGVETSLISMLNCIPKDKYKVKILTIYSGGELVNKVPNWIEVETIPEIQTKTIKKIIKRLKRFKIKEAVNILINNYFSKRAETISQSYKYSLKTLDNVYGEYDLAISYYNPTSFTVPYVIEKIKAKKKIMWIHSDVNVYDDIQEYKEYYDKYDYLYNVSKVGVNEFIKKFPSLSSKISVFYNIIDEENINEKSNDIVDIFNTDFKGINIVTVGRLSIEKGQDMIPIITRKLLDSGIEIRWYIIGEGQLREKIQNNIKKYNVDGNVILLGNIENPFPYIKQCDIYVQTSRSECYCTTVMEAKCLKKPMVITDVNGSVEQIDNGNNGIITKCSINDIYNSVMYLIKNNELRDKFILELSKNKINTKVEMDKLYRVMEE